ncbi:hypothetical protein D4764_0018250 [Takifugu flavidus]|uniref:Uncharacterized protein n=1 Tax=Takifugu flavidus TaxID=433684 RepID=A0A5C6MGQ8_9TELE|nr:hypothetical protein D4764_0018250 [Takifugu flavidus]
MYSHTGGNKQCERKTNTCFYSFSMKNVNTSQTGPTIVLLQHVDTFCLEMEPSWCLRGGISSVRGKTNTVSTASPSRT